MWLLCACLFHLINTLTLNIPFLQHLLVYWAFVDFAPAQAVLEKWWRKRGVRVGFAAIGVSFVLLHFGLRWAGVGRWLFFVIDEMRNNPIVLRTSAAIWVIAALVVAADTARGWRRGSRALA